jgi:hypothetical protein
MLARSQTGTERSAGTLERLERSEAVERLERAAVLKLNGLNVLNADIRQRFAHPGGTQFCQPPSGSGSPRACASRRNATTCWAVAFGPM